MSVPLETKLKELGFEQVQFEPKTNPRFFVKLDGIPSHAIKTVTFPPYKIEYSGEEPNWCRHTPLSLEVYNILGEDLEQKCLDIISKPEVNISIFLLTPAGEVDTTWKIVAKGKSATFGDLSWSDDQIPNMIYLKFTVNTATVSY